MKSKRCSHNLQSNLTGNCQRIALLRMSIFFLSTSLSTRFPTETEKMEVEGKSLPLLLVSYFLLRKKFSLLKWTLNLDNCMCERSVAVETRFLLWKPDRLLFVMWSCRIVTNSCTCVSLIHFTKLLNKKNWRKFEGFICRFLGKISV